MNRQIAAPDRTFLSGLIRKLLRLFLISIVLAGLAAWLVDGGRWKRLVERLTFFSIEDVRISSDWPLTPSVIQGWLPDLRGQNLLLVQPSKLLAILNQKSWVDSVTIRKEYPDRLTIEVRTRRAQAMTVIRGQAYFLDGGGLVIGKATPGLLRALDLPVVSWETQALSSGWDLSAVVSVITRFRERAEGHYIISQVVLDDFPYFKIFLDNPKTEVSFDITTWEAQLPILLRLLRNPPASLSRLKIINLIFPKKAVVSGVAARP